MGDSKINSIMKSFRECIDDDKDEKSDVQKEYVGKIR